MKESEYALIDALYWELRIQNDLKILEMKLSYGELKPTGGIRKRIKEIEKQRHDSIE